MRYRHCKVENLTSKRNSTNPRDKTENVEDSEDEEGDCSWIIFQDEKYDGDS